MLLEKIEKMTQVQNLNTDKVNIFVMSLTAFNHYDNINFLYASIALVLSMVMWNVLSWLFKVKMYINPYYCNNST